MNARNYTVSVTRDEFGTPRFFVTDEQGDWIGDPFDTVEAAYAEIDMLIEIQKLDDGAA